MVNSHRNQTQIFTKNKYLGIILAEDRKCETPMRNEQPKS